MAVASYAYGSTDGVLHLLDNVLAGGATFGPTTSPTLLFVEESLNSMAAELNEELQNAYYVVPISSTDIISHQLLVHLNNLGAARFVLSTRPGIMQGTGGNARLDLYNAEWEAGLRRIREHRFSAQRVTPLASQPVTGSRLDEYGNVREPIFTQDGFDYNRDRRKRRRRY